MTDLFRSLDDEREEQQAALDRELDPDMALASDWLSGELSDADSARVGERYRSDPTFHDLAEPLVVAYRHRGKPVTPPEILERNWQLLRQRMGLAPARPVVHDPTAEEFKRGVQAHERSMKRRAVWSMAAVILFAVVIPIGIDRYVEYRELRYATELGGFRDVRLGDGSRVILSGGTTIRFNSPITTTYRQVRLRGDALFEVASGLATPFVVETESAVITVTGTAFSVHAYEGEATTVHVAKGSVHVRHKGSDGNAGGPGLVLTQGQRAVAIRGRTLERIR